MPEEPTLDALWKPKPDEIHGNKKVTKDRDCL
jgi:hypothetical protein